MHCLFTFPSSVQAISIPQETRALFNCICTTLREMARVSSSTLPPYCYQVSWELREG